MLVRSLTDFKSIECNAYGKALAVGVFDALGLSRGSFEARRVGCLARGAASGKRRCAEDRRIGTAGMRRGLGRVDWRRERSPATPEKLRFRPPNRAIEHPAPWQF